jgi:hypothetical protein
MVSNLKHNDKFAMINNACDAEKELIVEVDEEHILKLWDL